MKQSTATNPYRLAFRGLVLTKGYNSKRLAEEIHISETKLSCRISGLVPWSLREAAAASKVLGISLDEFAKYFPA